LHLSCGIHPTQHSPSRLSPYVWELLVELLCNYLGGVAVQRMRRCKGKEVEFVHACILLDKGRRKVSAFVLVPKTIKIGV
jgi:hypothetical protein